MLVVTDRPGERYLTQLDDPAAATIFLTEGEPTVFVSHPAEPAQGQSWSTDVRRIEGPAAIQIVERLRELGADRAIVGVTGLDSQLHAPEGTLNYNRFIIMREWLPHARWVGASELMREATHVKSSEEIAALGLAARAAEVGLQAALAHRPQETSDRSLWARAVSAATLKGAEPTPELVLSTEGEGTTTTAAKPVDRGFLAGDLIHLQVTASTEGYRATLTQPVTVGIPNGRLTDAWKTHAEAWEQVWPQMLAGNALDGLSARSSSGNYRVQIDLVGVGMGDDLPWVSSGVVRAASLDGPFLKDGECFFLNVSVAWAEAGSERRLQWGDSVAITAKGPRRLGARPRELHLWK